MIDALIDLLLSLGGFLRDAVKGRRLQDDRGQHAVEAILRAINETKIYVASLARKKKRRPKREEGLARYWTSAAAALHGINDDLAARCRLKGEYWTNPDAWSTPQLEKARILLTQVATDSDTLLGWRKT